MALVKVYSRSPMAHLFTVVDGGEEVKITIKGMNAHVIGDHVEPFMNEVDELLFAKIVDKYKNHIKLFGGNINGVKFDPQIYVAKTTQEATKKANDSKPIFKNVNEIMVSKTKGVTPLTAKDDDLAV